MTLEDAIQRASIILPEHKKEFFKHLQNLPDEIYKWLYFERLADANSLSQGDILMNIPICFIDEEGDTIAGEDYVAMISNICDMQPRRKEFIIVSPIIFFDEYKKELIKAKKGIDNTLNDIRKNRIFSYFYLPSENRIPESFIDFSRMVSVSSIYLNNIKLKKAEQCLLSLSQYGFYLFLIKLTFHLARMEKV